MADSEAHKRILNGATETLKLKGVTGVISTDLSEI
jgi:hypothetical protein